MRGYASLHGLHFNFFRCLGLEMAVFPYSGDEDCINDYDVIYVRDNDIWRLQADDYNALIMGHDPVRDGAVTE